MIIARNSIFNFIVDYYFNYFIVNYFNFNNVIIKNFYLGLKCLKTHLAKCLHLCLYQIFKNTTLFHNLLVLEPEPS